jgi:hypothetical protein
MFVKFASGNITFIMKELFETIFEASFTEIPGQKFEIFIITLKTE